MSEQGAVVRSEGTFESGDGVAIFTRAWRPASPRAVVVIIHGLKSHSGLYDDVATALVAHGFAVHACDLRGHGRSAGDRQLVRAIDEYVADMTTLVARVRAAEPGLPLFVLGHSAGGLVAALYALDHQADLAGAVFESFAYEVPAPAFALWLMRGLSRVAPRAKVLKLKDEDFSRDPAVVTALASDPLNAHEPGPAALLAALVRGAARLRREGANLKLPLLLLHGTADKATRPSGSARLHREASAEDKTLKLYEGHVHDLLHDLGKEEVLADLVGWLEARVP